MPDTNATGMQANRRHWDEVVSIHLRSEFYDVASFVSGRSTLLPIEREEVGDVTGKMLLHLQCHFGLDTLSWARAGATVTGVDFSGEAIKAARRLADEVGLAERASFVESNIYALPENLSGQYDVVFTSYGAINWLPDIKGWAEVVSRFVRPGGFFYMVEIHPFANVLDDEVESLAQMAPKYPYFGGAQPLIFDEDGSYADESAHIKNQRTYEWMHTLGDIVNALVGAGLRIDFLREHSDSCYRMFPCMEEADKGLFRLKEGHGMLPLLFSLKAIRPE